MGLYAWQKERLEKNRGENYRKRKKTNQRLQIIVACLTVVALGFLFIDIAIGVLFLSLMILCWIFVLLNKLGNEMLRKQADKQLGGMEQLKNKDSSN